MTSLAPGQYRGRLRAASTVTSRIKGTPGISLLFALVDHPGQSADVMIWITEGGADIAMQDLERLGWNGNFQDPQFSVEEIDLYMQMEDRKDKPGTQQERWRISSRAQGAPPEPDDPVLAKFAARFKSRTKTAAPMGAPKAATPAPMKPAKTSRPAKGQAGNNGDIKTLEAAWAHWQEHKCEDESAFWAAVERVAGHSDEERVTADQWSKVAAAAPPF